MNKFIDPNHPFFANPLVRWVSSLAPVAWAFVEFVNGSPGWGMIFAALGALAFWVLIVRGPDEPVATDKDKPQD
ncbi:MAG: hypothetical protein U0934_10665 [Pseudotabrizicola sp.]|uniref:hypothetical protein n=1 Tax=Pseudotabrizicola sp. TaxID=2939647 RepID=UPI0027163A47|nr:hypothetical protein [Pseudotabrizicola sp.]MDO8882655.1 hypothetical protein [Pseudotabrizicola sp.]MDP2082871.1 hypothetical protein [Pseudotabrizicola sp.]MDZ7574403.1 hypothetical protein [Pseudotabrizicola sp.]